MRATKRRRVNRMYIPQLSSKVKKADQEEGPGLGWGGSNNGLLQAPEGEEKTDSF